MKLYRLFLTLLPLSIFFAAEDPLPKDESLKFDIHNTILARIHGKNISLIDLVKKMNQTMHQHYPKQMQSSAFCYQFYNARWKSTLDEAIDHELILADAESKEVKVFESEIREEMEKKFGPDVILTLDKLHLTYEEAHQSVKEELILQKMLGNYVYFRAMTVVTPEKIRAVFDEMVEEQRGKESWRYQVLSFRGNDAEKLVHEIVCAHEKNFLPKDFSNLLSEKVKNLPGTTFHISSELEVLRKDASAELLTTLETLKEKTYSIPQEQISRTDQKKVIRIFYLFQHTKGELPSFATQSEEIRRNLFNKAIEAAFSQYTSSLRQKFHVESPQEIAENFHPFSLQ